MVLPEVKELENVGMPRFEVDGKGSGTFVASLIDVTGSGIVRTQHWNNAIRITVGTQCRSWQTNKQIRKKLRHENRRHTL